MSSIPRDKSLESTIAFTRDPYRFVSKRCQRYQTELFEARFLMRPVICMSGAEMAKLFYDSSRFQRRGALPGRIQKTLFGRGGIQGLDNASHQRRKKLFLELTDPEHSAQLVETAAQCRRDYLSRWRARGDIVLYHELCEILTVAVCQWAGVPLSKVERKYRPHELTALFDAAGSVGPRHWIARLARRRTNRWMSRFIERIRAGEATPPTGSPAHSIAWHRDLDGKMLSPHVAAVEMLNILRPTVATSVYITFCALALHEHPESRERLRTDTPRYADWFVEEVRRFYPFFPAVTAVVRQGFVWRGYRFPNGRRVMPDLYGTNHDPRIWQDPDTFRPERFAQWDGDPFGFIPQGGGDRHTNHRCPGEPIAQDLVKLALRILCQEMEYTLPAQDLELQWSRIPALPRSRFVISVKAINPPLEAGHFVAGSASDEQREA